MSDIKFLDGKQVPEPLMTISSEGLWVNPAIPADETARLVVKSIDASIKLMVASAVRREREECAKVCEEMPWISGQSLPSNNEMAAAIRARGESK